MYTEKEVKKLLSQQIDMFIKAVSSVTNFETDQDLEDFLIDITDSLETPMLKTETGQPTTN